MAAVVIAAVPAVLPYVGAIVSACEHLFSHKPGSGKEKKMAALAMAQAGMGVLSSLESVPGTPVSGSKLSEHLSTLIDDTVAVLNDVGALHHSSPPAVVK